LGDQRHNFDDYFNNSLNDSLIDQSTSSIKKIDFMSENIELTDLGESSILKFLNEVSNKKNQYMHKHSITEMTINSLIEEINENIDDNEQPEQNLRPVHPRVANEVQIEKIIDSINAPSPLTRSRAT